MGKNASKNFVNQFKNTRRQAGLASRRPLAGLAGSRPLVGQALVEPRKRVKGQLRNLKQLLPGERKNDKKQDQGDK